MDDIAEIQKLPLIDLVWADVQGAEIDMIEGAEESFSKTRYIYTEYDDEELYEGQSNLEGILAALPNFEPVKVFKNDVLLKNKLL